MKQILLLGALMLGVLCHANEVTGQKIITLLPSTTDSVVVWTNPGPHEIYVYTVQVVNNNPATVLGPYWVDVPGSGTPNLILNSETTGTVRDFTPNWVVVGVGQQIRLTILGAQTGVEVLIWTTNPYDSAIYLQ